MLIPVACQLFCSHSDGEETRVCDDGAQANASCNQAGGFVLLLLDLFRSGWRWSAVSSRDRSRNRRGTGCAVYYAPCYKIRLH